MKASQLGPNLGGGRLGGGLLEEVLVPAFQGSNLWEEGLGALISSQIKAKLKCL